MPSSILMPLKIAYLVNQYPKVSHSFIRREILALEAQGVTVLRFAIRARAAELVDEADRQELQKTRLILGVGLMGLLLAMLRTAFQRPRRFWQALRLAVRVGLRSEQNTMLHLAYLAEACVLYHWLVEAQVSHLHAHFGTNSTTVAMLYRELGGVPYSFTVHGPEEFDKVQSLSLPEKVARSTFVVAISSYGRSQIYRWCPQDQWSKVKVVHCGVDDVFLEQPLTPVQNDRRVNDQPCPQLICVGRLCEQKGQLLLVEAAKQLVEEGLSFKLLLVGDGELRRPIEALIDRYHLADTIEITGWASSETVRQLLLESRTMVLPSFAEGLPVVIMESLALSRPVISTYVAGIPELVEPGVSGWLVPPGSVEALVSTMRQALQLPIEQLTQMGQAGAAQVAKQHHAMTEAAKLAALFQAISPDRPVQLTASPVLYATTASGNS